MVCLVGAALVGAARTAVAACDGCGTVRGSVTVEQAAVRTDGPKHDLDVVVILDRIDGDDPEYWPSDVRGGSHHMGTTRMHDDPTQGVVDRNCKVHGIDNLYVIGSSVFPTSGAANPTLTIVALTLRLADHLKSRGI